VLIARLFHFETEVWRYRGSPAQAVGYHAYALANLLLQLNIRRRPRPALSEIAGPAEDRMFDVSKSADDDRMSSPVEIPEDIFERVSTMCQALPEVTVRVDASLTPARSTAHSFDIRRRSFCLLVALESPTGKAAPLLVLRADPDERDALLAIGHPFYASRAGRDRIVVRLTDDTDWVEIRELLTESYRRLAPKKLTLLLDDQRRR
jgi:hypothetical protein